MSINKLPNQKIALKLFGILFLMHFSIFRVNGQTVIDNFEKKIQISAEDTSKVTLLLHYAREIRNKNLPEKDSVKITQLLHQALSLSEKLNYPVGISSTYIGLGNYYGFYLHRYASALEYYQKAFSLLGKIDSTGLSMGKVNENIASIYETIGAFPEAVKYNNAALTIYSRLNLADAQSRMYNQLGNIYAHLNQLDNAIDNSKKAIGLAKSINNNYLVAYYMLDLSGHYAYLNKQSSDTTHLNDALHYLNQALELCRNNQVSVQNKQLATEILLNLGNVYKLKGDFPMAKKHLEECLQQPDSLSTNYQQCYANGYLGDSYLLEGKYEAAEKYFHNSLQLAQKINSPFYLSFSYDLLYKLYEKKQDYMNAFLYHTKYKISNDSIYNLKKTEMVNQLNIKYETSQKEARIQILEKENNYRKNINRFLTYLAATIAILLASLYYLYKLRKRTFHQKEQIFKQEKLLEEKQKQLLQDEINFKARELTTNVMHLEKKNELLINIKNHLQELPLVNNNITKNEFKELHKLIDSAVQMDDDFHKFSTHFENVHPQFFERLRQRSAVPLTQLDLKLCAFTKMRLSTKEIANLLNVEARSVRTARYRTKQKFKDIKEDDFTDFLIQL